MNNEELIALGAEVLMPTYARFPIALVKGQGMRVWDADGHQYLDFLAGIAVCNLGHCHPAVTEALVQQAQTLVHVSNLYHIAPQTELAALLVEKTFADRIFFCNSGAEANEGAIKLARKVAYDKGETRRRTIITATRSFHGRTLMTLTATGQEKIKVGFDPLPPGFVHVPFNDIAALEQAVDETTAGVLLEPLQGEGGVNPAKENYLQAVRKLCDERGALMLLDEIQTGAGRTGTFLACEADGVTPDIVTLAKGLGGGVPIGALLATEGVASHFGPGTHGSTFGGNPLSAAAALATIRTLYEENLLAHCAAQGEYFRSQLEKLAENHAVITEVRGRGLLIGVQLDEAADLKAIELVKALMDRGFLTGPAGEHVLRFAPPLVVEKEEIDAVVVALDEVLKEQQR